MSQDSALPVGVSVPPSRRSGDSAHTEQHLLRESERISMLLQRRRKATTYILALFITATLAAAVVLYQFVRQQDAQIQLLKSAVVKADSSVGAQEVWVKSFEARSARADSIINMHDQMMALSEGRSRAAADSLIADSLRSIHQQLAQRAADDANLRRQLGTRTPGSSDVARLERRLDAFVETADLAPSLRRLNRIADSVAQLSVRVGRLSDRVERAEQPTRSEPR